MIMSKFKRGDQVKYIHNVTDWRLRRVITGEVVARPKGFLIVRDSDGIEYRLRDDFTVEKISEKDRRRY